ncbi:thiol peroxidase [Pseudochryseolinea flava]|uniref:Thiol peroxidase n=1 Tax=Pseudochryseolinea flava TaxID=2059302 RepID=A0A364YBQ4_9BACT|nr:thiol peroxidase [Pseudochryseolinea flava]RAW03208.1 thiol peroxidase [Pseudochryseolinea flava]
MAQTKLGENVVNTIGDLPAVGTQAPSFTLTGIELKDVNLSDYAGTNVILNIFPSIDTRVCAMSVREFNQRAASLPETTILCISKDLPFAFRRFCGAEGIDKVISLSDFRHKNFGSDYGLEMKDGGMAGLFARAIVVINKQGKVIYTELVPTIGQEPDYEKAILSLG